MCLNTYVYRCILFLTIRIGDINEGFLFLLQLQNGWTGGTDQLPLQLQDGRG